MLGRYRHSANEVISLPLDIPKTPAFGREEFQHNIKELFPGVAYDDTYALNTQSGTQWDGFRHVRLRLVHTCLLGAVLIETLLSLPISPPGVFTTTYAPPFL